MRVFHLLLVGAFLQPLIAYSASSSTNPRKFFFIELGAYANNLKGRNSAPAGYSSKVSATKPWLRLHPGFAIGKSGNWTFEIPFGTMIPTRDGIDGSTSIFESQLALQLGVPLFSFLKFRIGPGIEWLWLLSKQRDVLLRNGTDSSTFYTPSRSAHVFLMTVTGGLTIRLHNRWALFFDVYVPEVMSKARREYNASITLGFRF